MTEPSHFAARVKDFLASEKPEVLCIRGGWGVGKTFAWKKYLDEAARSDAIALKRYSYVSLFGVNSLDALRSATIENLEFLENGSRETVGDVLIATANKGLSAGSKFLGTLFQAGAEAIGHGALGAAGHTLMFAAVRNQIICIDDLERAGEGLHVRDVLGYMSFMKEERRCKVILILNDNQLGEAAEAFERNYEKVVDRTLILSPQPREAARIALAKFNSELAESVIKLGLTNIRIIKKIEAALELCEPALAQFDVAVQSHAIRMLALLGWSSLRADGAPPVDLFRNISGIRFDPEFVRSSDFLDRGSSQWPSLLENYGYSGFDDFDGCLLAALQQGYADLDALKTSAALVQRKMRNHAAHEDLLQAWRRYHYSFNADLFAVETEFSRAVHKHIRTLSTEELIDVIGLYSELGLAAEARHLLELFREHRAARRDVVFSQERVRSRIMDPLLAREVGEALGSMTATPAWSSPLDLLKQLNEGACDDSQLTALAALSQQDFVEAFKSLDGRDLSEAVSACLLWPRVSNAYEHKRTVRELAVGALREIAADGPLNASRVRRFGVNVGSPFNVGDDQDT